MPIVIKSSGSTISSPATSRNLALARANPHFEYINADVAAEGYDLARSCGGADLIVHCASPASPVDYALRPLETMAANSLGTKHCCEAARAWSARLLYASTSEAYGDPLEHPQRETYWGNVNPIGPRACYDESKRFGEAMVMTYVRTHGLDARIVRIFNTYGPRMRRDDGRVVPNFIGQALASQPLTLYGDGSQTRSFCYVSDLVDGIVRCADSERTRGLVVNLGNPAEITVAQLARVVCELVGVPYTNRPARHAGRRSGSSSPGYHTRAGVGGMGTADRARGWVARDYPLFRVKPHDVNASPASSTQTVMMASICNAWKRRAGR